VRGFLRRWRLGFLSRQIRNLQEAMRTTQAPSLAAFTKDHQGR